MKTNYEWFSLLELIVVMTIMAIGTIISFLSIGIIDDQKLENKSKEVQDFINNSKYNLITYKGDYVDIFLSSNQVINSLNYKNTLLFSYIGTNDCVENGEISWSNFYDKFMMVTGSGSPESLTFTGFTNTGITIVGFRQKTTYSFEALMPIGGVFDIRGTDSDLYKFDVFNDSKACARIFIKKLDTAKAEYFIHSIILNKIETTSSEGNLKIRFQKNLSNDVSSGSGYLTKVFFQNVTLNLSKWGKQNRSIIILNH